MVRHTLKILQHLVQDLKVCQTILGRYYIKRLRNNQAHNQCYYIYRNILLKKLFFRISQYSLVNIHYQTYVFTSEYCEFFENTYFKEYVCMVSISICYQSLLASYFFQKSNFHFVIGLNCLEVVVQMCSIKKAFLKISQNFQENISFFN